MEKIKKIYFNPIQVKFVTALQKIRCWIGGRGIGKSTGLAWILVEMMRELPRGRVFFSSTTLEQIGDYILPPIREKWKEMGFIEGVHFVVGKTPPAWYKKPINPPKNWENTIAFWNGFYVVLMSLAKSNGKRGGSFDAGIIDEAAFVKGNVFRSVAVPMVRGNLYRFDSHWHHSIIIMTSRPRRPEGYWVYDLKREAEANPEKIFYLEASAEENREVLGEEWFKAQKATLSAEEYDIEILNKEIRQIPTGFYHTFDRDKICYILRAGETDVQKNELLEMTWDFGGKFTCASAWQESGFVERCVRQFYSKQGSKVTGVVDQFCKAFATHEMKYVRIWGEPRGKDRDPERPDLYSIIEQRFAERGWATELMVHDGKKTAFHKERYDFFETAFGSADARLPQIAINLTQCEDLVKSIELTDCDNDYRKDKKAETDPSFPQEHAPHFGDGMDYYLYEKHGWRLASDPNARAGSAWS